MMQSVIWWRVWIDLLTSWRAALNLLVKSSVSLLEHVAYIVVIIILWRVIGALTSNQWAETNHLSLSIPTTDCLVQPAIEAAQTTRTAVYLTACYQYGRADSYLSDTGAKRLKDSIYQTVDFLYVFKYISCGLSQSTCLKQLLES